MGTKEKIVQAPKVETADKNDNNYMICPTCSDKSLISSENCLKCLSCGYSKCG